VNVMNVATHPRAPGRLGTFSPFVGAEKYAAVRKETLREERNARPPEFGCVDWYLYPVNRNPRQAER